jgi:hypothetical protein
MEAARRRELRDSLESRLEEESRSRGLTPRDRVLWVAYHLDLYVSRWLAFVNGSPHDDLSPFLHGTLWWMIETGTEALDRELRNAGPDPEVLRAWAGFLSRLEEIRTSEHRERARELLWHFNEFRRFLPASG